jgi:hypothetical protein
VTDEQNDTATADDRALAGLARAFGALFEICGEAGASGAEPAFAVALAALSGRFAWHAELLFDVLPVRRGIDRNALVDSPVPGADDAMVALGGLAERGETVAFAVSLARVVVPWLVDGVARASAGNDPRLEGPRARALALIARDLDDSAAELAARIGTLGTQPGRLDRALAVGAVAASAVALAAGGDGGASAGRRG